MPRAVIGSAVRRAVAPPRGCYRTQVLVAGRDLRWSRRVSSAIRGVGYQVTACDNGRDALAVLVLGLPIDVLVIGAGLAGQPGGAGLAAEARALRPGLRIVLTLNDPGETHPDDLAGLFPEAVTVAEDPAAPAVARAVRAVLSPSDPGLRN